MSDEQGPAFWRSLYRTPTESEADVESTGFHVVIAADDLIAERVGANEIAAVTADIPTIDPAAVKTIVNKLLKKHLAEMAAKGMLVAPGSAPGARSAAPQRDSPHENSPQAAPAAAPGGHDHAATNVDHDLPPWEEAPEDDPSMGLDTQASTVTIDDADVEDEDDLFVAVEDDDDEDDLFVAMEDDDEDDDEGDLFVEIDEDDDYDDDEVVVDIAEGDESDSFEALWNKVPILPGGQSSLIGVDGLSPTAPMVLVLIDGVSTLKGLKMLVPHVSKEDFQGIIEDGMSRGLVVFD